MVYELKKTGKFKDSLKLARKRGLDISLLEEIIDKLRTDTPLAPKHRNHELMGKFKGVWECHIQPDWLLLYTKNKNVLVLTLIDTGTHSDLFREWFPQNSLVNPLMWLTKPRTLIFTSSCRDSGTPALATRKGHPCESACRQSRFLHRRIQDAESAPSPSEWQSGCRCHSQRRHYQE